MEDKLTRKAFLLTSAAAVLGGIAVACGGGSESNESASNGGGGTAAQSGGAKTAPAADPCGDLSGLTEADKNLRTALKYVPKSPEADKHCVNCKFWNPPEDGATCGGCQLLKGPINPEGYCTSWFTREETGAAG